MLSFDDVRRLQKRHVQYISLRKRIWIPFPPMTEALLVQAAKRVWWSRISAGVHESNTLGALRLERETLCDLSISIWSRRPTKQEGTVDNVERQRLTKGRNHSKHIACCFGSSQQFLLILLRNRSIPDKKTSN